MSAWRVVLLAGLLPAAQGCLALPVPNWRMEGYGVKSRVVNAHTGDGVANAQVIDQERPQIRAKTDATGEFQMKPFVQFHAGYLYGVISYPILPFTGDAIRCDRSIKIVAPGYDDAQFLVSRSDHGRSGATNQILGAKVDGEFLVIRSFAIRQTEPSTSQAQLGLTE